MREPKRKEDGWKSQQRLLKSAALATDQFARPSRAPSSVAAKRPPKQSGSTERESLQRPSHDASMLIGMRYKAVARTTATRSQ
jgi:hypothetical protein